MPASTIDDDRLQMLFDATGIARGFLADRPMRRGHLEGRDGVYLTVRLTSYRSLPLSCIEGIRLSIDGVEVEPEALRLVIAGVPYALADLTAFFDRWWFILDFAELFAPLPDVAAGAYDVEAVLVTVEPYMTAGRFSMFNPDHRTLMLGEAA